MCCVEKELLMNTYDEVLTNFPCLNAVCDGVKVAAFGFLGSTCDF